MGPVQNLRIPDETLTTSSVFIEWDEADNAQSYDVSWIKTLSPHIIITKILFIESIRAIFS